MRKTQNLILGIPDTPEEKVTPSPPRADVANNASSSDGVVEGDHYAGVYGQTPTAWKTPVGGTTVDDGKTSAGVVTPSNATTRPSFDDWYKTVPADRNDMSNYNLRRAYELAPWDKLEAWRTAPIEDLTNIDEDKNPLRTYYKNQDGDYEFMVPKGHLSSRQELDWYRKSSNPDAERFREEYRLDDSGDFYKYVRRHKDASTEKELKDKLNEMENEETTNGSTSTGNSNTTTGYSNTATGNSNTTTGNSNTTSGNRATPSSNNVATNQGTTNDAPTDGVVGDDHNAGVYGDNQGTGSNQDTDDKSINASPVYQSRIDQLLEEDEDEKAWRAKQDAARVDIIKALEDEANSIGPAETPEEREKRKKREKRNILFSKLSDGFNSIANLYFTTKGAPNLLKENSSLTGKTRESIERMRKEREADRDRWLKLETTRYGMIDDAIKQRRATKKEQLTLLLQAQKAAEEANLLRQRAETEKQQGNLYAAQVLNKQAEVKETEANTKKLDAQRGESEERTRQLSLNGESQRSLNAARANQATTAAGVNVARTQQIRSGRDSSSKPVGTLEGVDYYNNNDYNSAVHRRANELGIGKSVQRPTGYDTVKDRVKYETHEKSTAELAAEIEQKSKKGGAKPSGKGKFSSFSIHKNKK